MHRRDNLPLLQRMALLEVKVNNDNQQLSAGAVEPESRLTYGDIVHVQRAEGIHHDWHARVKGI